MQSGKGSTRQQEGEGASASGPPPPPTSAPPLVGTTAASDDGPSSSGNGSQPSGEESSSWPSWLSKSDVETVAIAVAISYAIRIVSAAACRLPSAAYCLPSAVDSVRCSFQPSEAAAPRSTVCPSCGAALLRASHD